ncbi:TIM barrel protein [Romboutsia ilealis]|uniref:TIM barrel protein n=1 Tax=Romboutsia ilealis TaxID=1115758 RepID=UPI002674EAB2|nr:TIM barrel protein [Romboutsia ilealis]
MIKVINLSTYQYDMDRYNNNYKNVNKFLEDNNLNAIELFGLQLYSEELIPKDKIKGVHLMHYPVWLDFWNEDEDGIFEEFNSKEDIINYYGKLDKKVIVDKYREEIKIAEKLNAEYAVFHVSNVRTKHCFNYEFTYTDKEVVDATIEIVNEIFRGLNTNITILFENLWWPGLRMTDQELVKYFIENIEYEHKGFMLDTGHLLNTNLDINTEEEGIDYLIETVKNLGDMKEFIKGIHLSKSLSGKYVKNQIEKYKKIEIDSNKANNEIIYHILKIDEHKPFTNNKINNLIEMINPKYLVYEFITTSLEELSNFIKTQNKVLGL